MADSYGSVPPPGQSGGGAVDFSKLIQLAKERAAQVAKGVTPPPPPPIVASGANAEGLKRPRDDGGSILGAYGGEPDAKRPASSAFGGIGGLSSSSMPTMQLGLGAQDQEIMDVVATSVGVVIGKGGDNIKRVQSQSGARVQVAPDAHDGVHRRVTITGDSRSVAMAKQMIQQLIDEAGVGNPSASGQHLRIEITVPANKVGMVIGRGGEKIRELQARTGAHIKVLQDGPHQTAAVKPVVIQGEPSAVEQARTLIEDLVKDEPAPPPAPVPTAGAHHYGTGSPAPDRDHRGSVTGPPAPSASHGLTRTEMLVPSSSVGLIIGTAGSTIKGMQQRTGARIQLQQDTGAPERTVVFEGTQNAVEMAQREVEQLVEEAKSRAASEPPRHDRYERERERERERRPMRDTVRHPVLASKVGLVIGKGGETIRSIQQETGAHVQLDRDAPPGPNKFFIIEGTPEQIEHVKKLMYDRVGGPMGPPGFAPFGGPAGWGAPVAPPAPYGGWGPPPPPGAPGAPPAAPGGWGAPPPAAGGYSAPPAPPAPWAAPGGGYTPAQPPPPPPAAGAAQPPPNPGYGGYGGYGGYSAPAGGAAPPPPPASAAAPAAPAPQAAPAPAAPAAAPAATSAAPQGEMTEQQKIWAKQWEEYYARMGQQPPQQQ